MSKQHLLLELVCKIHRLFCLLGARYCQEVPFDSSSSLAKNIVSTPQSQSHILCILY